MRGAVLVLLLAASPAAAQDVEPVRGYIAEARRQLDIDPRCPPQAEGEEIIVCGSRVDAERYRLPIRPDGFNPNGPVKSVSRERNALLQDNGGGVASCSTVGPGGMYGCAFQAFKHHVEQHAE